MTFTITDDRPPVAVMSEHCRRDGCDKTFELPYEAHLFEFGAYAYQAGWSLHPSLGWVCPAHEYGIPIAELEADEASLSRSRQALIDTGVFPAVTEDEGPAYCAYCEMPIRKTATGWAHRRGEACGNRAKPIPAQAITEEVASDA
jgi:hypothetical protein